MATITNASALNTQDLSVAAGTELTGVSLVAVTVKVYVVPLVRPVRVIGDEAPETTCRPSLEVTVYEVMVDPPLFAGAEKVMVA